MSFSLPVNFPLLLALSSAALLSLLTYRLFPALPEASTHQLWMRGFMVYFFWIFGLLKFVSLSRFVAGFSRYDLLAGYLPFFPWAYPFIELVLGGMLAVNFLSPLANGMTIFLSLEVALSVSMQLRKKQPRFLCACMGTAFSIPLTKLTVIENLMMASMALMMLFNF